MSNISTTNNLSIVANIPAKSETNYRSKITSFNYDTELEKAAENDLSAIIQIGKFVREKLLQATQRAQKADQKLRINRSRRQNDPNVSKLRNINQIYANLRNDLIEVYDLAKDGNDVSQHQVWERLTNHHITGKDVQYMGPISALDLALLTESSITYSNPYIVRGMSDPQMQHLNWGTLIPVEEGFLLTVNKQEILLEGEMAHQILISARLTENTPWNGECVIPSKSLSRFNGYSLIIPPLARYTNTETGEVIESPNVMLDLQGNDYPITEDMRISMSSITYDALVASLAFARYGNADYEQESNLLITCFGEARAPKHACDVQYYFTRSWFDRVAANNRDYYFGEGRTLNGLSEKKIANYELYCQAWPTYQALIAARQEAARLAREERFAHVEQSRQSQEQLQDTIKKVEIEQRKIAEKNGLAIPVPTTDRGQTIDEEFEYLAELDGLDGLA
jgi:hypothetical protein